MRAILELYQEKVAHQTEAGEQLRAMSMSPSLCRSTEAGEQLRALLRVASSTDLKLRTALALEADQHRTEISLLKAEGDTREAALHDKLVRPEIET
ncbi:hypothetical protein T484DRAFT_1793702 [Baffinella frigidus]|nr:hypothetical protein T484DRAFT_1793702 [Cryptophyta sp. CCMP2293]